MKVLILTTVMAPYRVQLFEELGKFCDLTVCFEQKKDKNREDDWYEKQSKNFRCVCLKKWDKSLKRVKLEIIDIVNKVKPDIAIAYEYSTVTAMCFMSWCRILKIPYVINCDGAFVSKSYKGIIKRYFIKRATAYLASGRMAKEYFMNYGAKEENIYFHKFTTLHKNDILTTVLTKEQKNLLKEKINISYDKVILAVGRFMHQKGFDILIEAATRINKDIGVYIVGGKINSEYETLIEKHRIDNIHFKEFMVPEDLSDYFAVSDIFVLPTRGDVWGLVVNEAMAKGLPVITTDKCVAGIELIENDINGYITTVEDIEALAEAINKVVDNDSKIEEMGSNNLRKISEYTIENSAQEIYRNLKEIYELNYKEG